MYVPFGSIIATQHLPLASTVSYDGIVLLVDVVVFDANAAVVADGGDNVVRSKKWNKHMVKWCDQIRSENLHLGLSGYGML